MFVMIHTMKSWRLYCQGKNYITMNLFWKDRLKVVMLRVNETRIMFSYDITFSD